MLSLPLVGYWQTEVLGDGLMVLEELRPGDFFRFVQGVRYTVANRTGFRVRDVTYTPHFLSELQLCRYLTHSRGGHRFLQFGVNRIRGIITNGFFDVIKDHPCKCCHDCCVSNPYVSIVGCCTLEES